MKENVSIDNFLNGRVSAGDFPSAVYLCGEKGKVIAEGAIGHAVCEPEVIGASLNTIYDLASLTKVLVTGLLAAQLVETGKIRLDDKVSKYLEEFAGQDKTGVTIGQLVTHTSRLPAWRPLYLLTEKPGAVIETIAGLPLLESGGVTYSDLNFICLANIIERVTGEDLRELFTQNIVEPLSLKHTGFCLGPENRQNIAASERGNKFERQTCIDQGYFDPEAKAGAKAEAFFRSEMIWGEVHDGNAYFLKGVAGHAGLFSTAEEVFKIALQFLPNSSTILSAQTCFLFHTDLTPDLNEHRSFAFEMASTPGSTASHLLSPLSFGHLGFTGTSLWVDPERDRVYILLTNRTHCHEVPFENINSVRRRFHELAATLATES